MNTTNIRTADGVELAMRVEPPAGGSSTTGVVVTHGFGASSKDPRVRAVAAALCDAGHTAVSYDARGHGASGGESTLGALELLDVAAACQAAHDAGAARVVVVGTSMGAIAALRYAAESDAAVAGVVTVACPAEWKLPRNPRGVLAAAMVETRPGRSFARTRLGVRIAPKYARGAPPVELVRSVRVPLVVIHGAADRFINAHAADLLVANAAGPVQHAVVPGLAHAFDPPDLVIPAVLDGVDWALSH
jgi:pimeloyl-ACP methyl ester carboxylesterase